MSWNMSDIRNLTIVTGPTKLAYDFDAKSGSLTVWLGKYAKDAPVDARRTDIASGNTQWSIFDSEVAADVASLAEKDGGG